MTSNSDNQQSSPMHLGLTGQFSPEDLQELLGVMGDHSGDHSNGMSSRGDGFGDGGGGGGDLQREGSTTTTVSSSSSGQPPVGLSTAPPHPLPSYAPPSLPGEEAKAQARSERKRSREKQRRSDVNKQFADLTQLLQKIDAEDVSEEDLKNGTSASRVTFNPSNRVDLIARTIILLERLHEANKKRKTEISSLEQQLEVAKKAGEDTAAKLKEAMLAPPGQPMNKQFMMMVPMMMSSDGTGATSAVPMMNPYMQQATMTQAYCPMPAPAMAPQISQAPGTQPAGTQGAPTQASAAQPPAPTGLAPGPAPPNSHQQGAQPSGQPAPPQHPQMQAPTPAPQATFPFIMPAPMAGGGYMMPMATGNPMGGQAMTMVPAAFNHGQQHGQQEQKDTSSPNYTGGNLAHCA